MESKLPNGWVWKEHWEKNYGEARLYAPKGCHAGDIRKSYSKEYCSCTWDEDGTGGENSAHNSVEEAKNFVEEAIIRQGFHIDCEFNCSDLGDDEYAAEIAADHWQTLDDDGKEAIEAVMEAMLGAKKYHEWREELDLSKEDL